VAQAASVQPEATLPFSDGFDAGLGSWTTTGAATSADGQLSLTAAGQPAAADLRLAGAPVEIYARVKLQVIDQGTEVTLFETRGANGALLAAITMDAAGRLIVAGHRTSAVVGDGQWHELEVRVRASDGLVDAWFDGAIVKQTRGQRGAGVALVRLGTDATGEAFALSVDQVALDQAFLPLTMAAPTATATSTTVPTPTATPTPPLATSTPTTVPTASPTELPAPSPTPTETPTAFPTATEAPPTETPSPPPTDVPVPTPSA
jgi:hypothetical protein